MKYRVVAKGPNREGLTYAHSYEALEEHIKSFRKDGYTKFEVEMVLDDE